MIWRRHRRGGATLAKATKAKPVPVAEGVEGRLEAVAADFQKAETNINRALERVSGCEAAYREASDTVRRQFNLAFFERLLIDDDYTVTGELAPPFDTILSDKLRRAAIAKADETTRAGPAAARGPN